MRLVIDRSKWYRGKDTESALIIGAGHCMGKMCCLGFLGIAVGYAPEQLDGVPDPESVNNEQPELKLPNLWPKAFNISIEDDEDEDEEKGFVRWRQDHVVSELIRINDAKIGIQKLVESEQDREQQLAAKFLSIGIEVEFVDGP